MSRPITKNRRNQIMDDLGRVKVSLPPGRYTAKVRDVKTDPVTGKVTITFDDVKPNTTPQPPRGPMRRLVRRKE